MIGLLRVGGLIGGMLLLIITVGGHVLRQDESRAYWMIVRDDDTFSLMMGNGEHYGTLDETYISYQESIYWSPDSQWMIYAAGGLRSIHVERPEHEYRIGSSIEIGIPVFSPDSDWIIFQDYSSYKFLVKVRPDGSEQSNVLSRAVSSYYGWTADGDIYYRLRRSTIEHPELIPPNTQYIVAPQIENLYLRLQSPISTEVLGHNRFGIYREVDSDGDGVWQRITPEGFECLVRGWLPTDWIICTHRTGDSESVLYKLRPDGSELSVLLESSIGLGGSLWSENGEWMYFESRDGLMRININSLKTEMVLENNSYRYPIMTDDHRWLIIGGDFGEGEGIYKINLNRGTFERLYLLPEQTILGQWNDPYQTSSNSVWVHVNSINPSDQTEVFHCRVRISDGHVEVLPNGVLMNLSPQFTMLAGDGTPIWYGIGLVLGALGMMGRRLWV